MPIPTAFSVTCKNCGKRGRSDEWMINPDLKCDQSYCDMSKRQNRVNRMRIAAEVTAASVPAGMRVVSKKEVLTSYPYPKGELSKSITKGISLHIIPGGKK